MQSIEKLLAPGRENTRTSAELCAALGCTERTLRKTIERARAAGAEILFDPGGQGGYFLPSLDPAQAQAERLAFYFAQRARAFCTLKTLRPVARALGIAAWQLDPFDEDAAGGRDAG